MLKMRIVRNFWRLKNNVQQSSFAACRISNIPLLEVNRVNFDTVRWQSSGEIWKNFARFIGIGPLSKSVTRVRGYGLYENVTNTVNYQQFFMGLNMPDTFHSWFLVTELHVWMLMVRLMNEGKEGRMIRNALVGALWEDVEQRSKQLGDIAASIRRQQIQTLVQEFHATLFSFDEGLQSSDHVLAGALWRNFFSQKEFNPEHLKLLIEYIRQNIHHLDSLLKEDVIEKRFRWSSPPFS